MMTTEKLTSHASRCLAAVGLAALLFASESRAQVIVDAGGFEAAAGYSTTFDGDGKLEGQVPATFNGTWLRTSGPALSTATVQSGLVKSGTQAVQVDRAANSDDRWAVPVVGYPSTGVDTICICWDMLVRGPAGTVGTDFGPFFGVEAYDDNNAGQGVGLIGSLGVDATTGDVLYQAADTGVFKESGEKVEFGEWNRFNLFLDYSTKTYSIYFNNSLVATEGFVDENNIPGGLIDFTDADIAALAASANSQGLTGTAFFDNFTVHEGVPCGVPEPTTALMVLAGLVCAGCRRQR
jgi:hypothetical protein